MSYSIFCGYGAISSVVILQAPTPESLAPSVNSRNWSHWLGITAPGDLMLGEPKSLGPATTNLISWLTKDCSLRGKKATSKSHVKRGEEVEK